MTAESDINRREGAWWFENNAYSIRLCASCSFPLLLVTADDLILGIWDSQLGARTSVPCTDFRHLGQSVVSKDFCLS